jgi:hypothetical protein
MGTWLRRLAFAALLGVVVFASVTASTLARGEVALAASDAAFDAGRLRDAVVHARRAAVAYVPGAPHVRAAYARLHAIAIGAESSGHPAVAREAWEAMRAAALESRHVVQPHEEDLRRANEHLARLLANDGVATDAGKGRERLAELLARDTAPRAARVALLVLGFVLAIAGLGALAWKGVTREGRLVPSRARAALVLTVLGVACWTIAVYRA